jgi:flagellar basal body-associated protein FliL
MADDEEKKQDEKQVEEQEKKPEAAGTSPSGFGVYTWIILGVIVIAGATGGFALSQLLAGGGSPSPVGDVQSTQQEAGPQPKTFDDIVSGEAGKVWYHELDPVIANLDEPGVTRYLRATITLELSSEMDQDKGTVFLSEKTLVMRDWLTTYIAGLSLERIRGTRNLSRIKKEVRDHFNDLLFPDSKPYIHGIFLKDFAVQ